MNSFFSTLAFLQAAYCIAGVQDICCLLVLDAMPHSKSSTIAEIQKRVEKKFKLRISPVQITNILKKLKQRKLVRYETQYQNISLLSAGIEAHIKLQQEREKNLEKTNFLLAKMKRDICFLGDISILEEKFKKFLWPRLFRNAELFEQDAKKLRQTFQSGSEVEEQMVNYILKNKEEETAEYDTLQKLAIAASSYAALSTQIDVWEQDLPFEKTEIYLDASILFSLFGFHGEVLDAPVQALFQLLKDEPRFTLKVWDYTLEEMRSVLAGYQQAQQYYFPEFEVSSIYYHFTANDISPEQVKKEILPKLEQKIEKVFGLKIEYSNKELRAEDLTKSKIQELKSLKMSHKTKTKKVNTANSVRLDFSAQHDIFAISAIKKLRGNTTRHHLEESKAFFLTADGLLSFFNFHEYHHRDRHTIPEVIHYAYLLNALWLQDPKKNAEIPLLSIVAGMYQGLMIDIHVWETFFRELKALQQSGKYSDEEIVTILSSNVLQSHLRRTVATDIDARFFRKMYKKGREEKNKAMKKVSQEIKEKLEQDITEREHHYLHSKTQTKFKQLADKMAVFCIHGISAVSLFIISYICYVSVLFIGKWWDHLEPDLALLTFWVFCAGFIIHFSFGTKLNPIKVRQKIYDYLFGRFYRFLYRNFAVQ